jgi:putative phosphoribosyl transferase
MNNREWTMHGSIDSLHVERRGWVGECEFVARPRGVVLLVRSPESSDSEAPDRSLCDVLHGYRLSTLQFGLLAHAPTSNDDAEHVLRWLTRGVDDALDWLRDRGDLAGSPLGLLGIGLGGAAVLRCAAQQPGRAAAVVSRNGRPDLVAAQLPRVQAATLLILGSHDAALLPAHRSATRALVCSKRMEVVPGTAALDADPAALDAAAHLAGIWFVQHLEPGTLQ